MSRPFIPADGPRWLIDTQCVFRWCIIPSDVCLHWSPLTPARRLPEYISTTLRSILLIQFTLRSLLPFLSHILYNTVVDRPNPSHKMFKSIITFSLISLSLSLTSVSAAPMPMNFRLARRDGGSAYSGVGGEANGGNVNKYNRWVYLFYSFLFDLIRLDVELEKNKS
jgi:hypothetical protein